MYNSSLIRPQPGIQYNRAHPLAQGIASGWLLNGNSGMATYDFVQNYKGIFSGQLNRTGSPYGGAVKFDDTNTIDISSVFNAKITDISICCWVNIISLTEGGAFVKWGNNTSGIGIGQGNTTFDNTGANIIILYETLFWQTSHATTLGWHFFCFVAGSANSYVYQDGVLRNTVGGGNTVLPSTTTYIGGYQSNVATNRRVAHPIAMVRFYNRALTSVDVKALHVNPFIDFHGSKTVLFA